MFAVSRGRGGLDVKLDDIADRRGLLWSRDTERTGDIRVDPPPSPPSRQRRATPLSSRRVAAGDQQIREPQDAMRCLFFATPRSPWRSQCRTGCSTFARTDALRFSAASWDALARRRRPGFHYRLEPARPTRRTWNVAWLAAVVVSCADPRPPRCAPSSRNTTMHLRVPCAAPVLRRRRRVDDARVNDRPRAQPMAARRRALISSNRPSPRPCFSNP